MMNQAASANRRPVGSTASAGCCPMFNAPFFMNTLAPQAPLIAPPAAQPCFLGSQSVQLPQITSSQPQQNNVLLRPTNLIQQQQSQHIASAPLPHQQQIPQRPQDNTNFNASLVAPNLSLQQILASHPVSNCMALAAAIARLPHFQQLQQPHHQTPINQNTNTSSSNTVNPVPSANTTNQVPILNFNGYHAAQPFINLTTHTGPPLNAHLNLSNTTNHQQQSNSPASQTAQANTGNHQVASQNHHPIQLPMATNTALNNAANQQQPPPTTNHRSAPVNTAQSTLQQPQSAPAQQLGQLARNILSDEALTSLLGDQFQAMLLNQLLTNHPFAPTTLTQPAPPQRQQQVATNSNPSRQPPAPSNLATAGVPASTQQVAVAPLSQQLSPEQASGQQHQQTGQQNFQAQPTAQSRVSQVPNMDTFASSATPNVLYQQQHTNSLSHQPQALVSESVSQHPTQQQQTPQQQQQPQTVPTLPPYPLPPLEQAAIAAILTNPQLNNFIHIFNMHLQNNSFRSEQHTTHHHHHQPHHFHHHLHGSHHHHHHHHGPNGQNNGQDVAMPIDSLAINESKPRGLNRAEIDSLTPYIHVNEKDSRTCVICLSKFELKSKIRPLPCNHAFHAKCVDKWLRANRTCPLCRRDALKAYSGKIKRV